MARKTGGLGRGFYEIYDDNNLEKGSNQTIRISDIDPRHDQPRKTFDREALEALADSIAAHGVLQPIIVRENDSLPGTYEIIAGERRWRASKMAGLTEIPAIVFDGDELKAAQVALIENIQREDLSPVEEAFAYGALIEKFGLTQDQVAKQVGKSRSAVANILRLLNLPDEVLTMLKNGEITEGHARALLGLDDDDEIIALAEKIVPNNMTVRGVEFAVRRINERKFEDAEARIHPQVSVHMKELERRAMSSLGRKVRISRSTKRRVVELTYDNDEDLETLLISLCGSKIFSETQEL